MSALVTESSVAERTDTAEVDVNSQESVVAVDSLADTADGHGDVATDAAEAAESPSSRHLWARVFGAWVLPVVALLLALAAGYLKYEDAPAREAERASIESVQVAKDGVVALLSYTPTTAAATLTAARDRLTGSFRDSYISLTDDVVIPGAKQKQVSSTATVPAAASQTATSDHAVVLVFVDQSVIIGDSVPTETASAVEVTLDKVGNRWLIAEFDPK